MACVPSEDSDQTGHPPSQSLQWVAKDPRLLHVDSEDSDQTVFAGRTAILLVLSCRGSNGKANWINIHVCVIK